MKTSPDKDEISFIIGDPMDCMAEWHVIDEYLRPKMLEGSLNTVDWITELRDIYAMDPEEMIGIGVMRRRNEWWFYSNEARAAYMLPETGFWGKNGSVTPINEEFTAWKLPLVFESVDEVMEREEIWTMDRYTLALLPQVILCRLLRQASSRQFQLRLSGLGHASTSPT